jgi:hypothetical protein
MDPKGIDLDEDIFGFDKVDEEETGGDDFDLDEIIASFRDEEDAAQPVPTMADDDEVIGSEPAPPPAPPVQQLPEAGPVRTIVASGSFAKPLIIGFVALTIMNAAFVTLALKSSGSVREELQDVNESVERALAEATETRQQRDETGAPPAVLSDVDVFEPELADAKADLDAGHTAAARRRVYSMLARIDKLPPERREVNEAQARFLIAETYHAEALLELEDQQ